MIVEIALVCALVAVLIAALMVAIFRPIRVLHAEATSTPRAGSVSATADAPPTPAPTVTVFVDAGPSNAVRITSFLIGPNPVDCTNPAVAPPLDMHWSSVNGTKASLSVDSLVIAPNLPPSGDNSDLPASIQPLVYGCNPPYDVFKLTVSNGAGSVTKIVTVVRKG